jgi:hypothetical protein
MLAKSVVIVLIQSVQAAWLLIVEVNPNHRLSNAALFRFWTLLPRRPCLSFGLQECLSDPWRK